MRAEPADPAMPDAFKAVLSAQLTGWTDLPAEHSNLAMPADAYKAVVPAEYRWTDLPAERDNTAMSYECGACLSA